MDVWANDRDVSHNDVVTTDMYVGKGVLTMTQ